MSASCYILFLLSEPLKNIGRKLGQLLHLPEDVVASTFQALATSGPEIVMAVLAATPFITHKAWKALELGEKASSGTLNIVFSAMSNLLGIGAVTIIVMIRKGMIDREEVIRVEPSVKSSLIFYSVASTMLAVFILDAVIQPAEAWTLMALGTLYVVSQFFLPGILRRLNRISKRQPAADQATGRGNTVIPQKPLSWLREFSFNSLLYAFLVFALIVLVREAMGASFNMAISSVFSLGGIIIMFTSYISSFPEFMLTFRYAVENNKSALLGMLFGSNVIDLAFTGFRSLWRNEPMPIYSTGPAGFLLPVYIWIIPLLSILASYSLLTGKLKYKSAYPLVGFYVVYIVSGFILL